jgi:hypothetical protein
MITKCSYCNSVMNAGTGEAGEKVSHGICTACAARINTALTNGGPAAADLELKRLKLRAWCDGAAEALDRLKMEI